MARANLRLELPGGTWKGDVSREYRGLTVEVLESLLDGGRATETVRLTGRQLHEPVATIESHADVVSAELIERSGERVTMRLERCEPAIHAAAAEAEIPLIYPATVATGVLSVAAVGTHDKIAALRERLERAGFGVELTSIQEHQEGNQVLTDRQAEVVSVAVELGYYQSPRTCSMNDVADHLDIAKSTCSETLQRAEESIVEYFCLQHELPSPIRPRQSQDSASQRTYR